MASYADAGVLEISLISAPAVASPSDSPGVTSASQCPDYAHAAKAAGSRVVLSSVDTLWRAEAS